MKTMITHAAPPRPRRGAGHDALERDAAFALACMGLGLVGVAALINGDSTGTTTLITTVETMVAIALGVLVGRAISITVSAREGRRSASGR